MTDKKVQINEDDVARHMRDQACRAESGGIAQKKYSHFQKLVTKVYALSDKEFDIAFSTLESMIENFNSKKTKPNEDDKKQQSKEKTINIITNKQ
ncbi:hypothetical protein [Silvanigrella aquatica]|uniref:Uncharacterized protein n=1 Tax=Silvanigrella aquatica TaxID=1915309 RepID=A0A1L4D3H6_9BACT|nr:hypothetical protein [Silvanigrella aquatica]APJ04754.1 hypothetical protein AXG55_12945 [Silvanigrella aquatica]